jgi:hypothetical protein
MAGWPLSEGAAAQNEATRALKEMLGGARSKREQRAWLVSIGLVGLIYTVRVRTLKFLYTLVRNGSGSLAEALD